MEKRISTNKRVYLGVFLIAVGVIWILERLNLIPDIWDDILISWQMLLIGIGIFAFLGGNKTTGTVLIVIGGFFLLDDFLTIPYEIRRIGWPLLFIGIGVILLVKHGRRREIPPMANQAKSGVDYFDDFVIFGGREIFINSLNFYGGKNTSIFGGSEYDMRQTKLSENGAVIDCLSVFGGCGFKVPPDWTVKNEVTAIFGGFTDKRGKMLNQVPFDPSKTLIIRGFVAFGGIEVKHF